MQTFRTIAVYVALIGTLAFGPILPVFAESADLKAARQALSSGDYARATTLFTNVLQGSGLEPAVLADIYYERGMAQHHQGALTQAISDYTNAIWLGALSADFEGDVFLSRAIAQLEGNQLSRAETDFDSAIAKNPKLVDAYFGRATVRRLQAELDAAIADYDKAIALHHPSLPLVYFGRGLANEALSNTMDAGVDFAQAAKADASFAPARAKLAAMGLPVPAPDPAAATRETPSTGVAAISVAGTPGLEVALGIAPDDDTATASLRTDGLSPADAASAGAPADSEFLRPSSEGLLAGADTDATAGGVSGEAGAEAQIAAALPADEPAPKTETATTADLPPAPAETDAPPPAADAPQDVASAAGGDTGTKTEASAPAPEPVATAAASVGAFYVQIASFQQKALAEKGRLNFGEKFPEIAVQVPPSIVEADLGPRGIVYRLRLGPLDNAADSAALCTTLKKSGQDCIVVPPSRAAG